MTERRVVGRAELSALRLFAIVAALLATILAAFTPLTALQRGLVVHPSELWMLVALGLIAVTGLAAPWVPARGLRIMAGVAAAGWVLLQLGMLWQTAGQAVLTPWVLTASAAAVAAALVAGGLVAAWVVQLLSSLLVLVHRSLLGDVTFGGWVNDTQTLVVGVVVAAIGAITLDAGRRLDEAVAERAAAASAASSARGRLAARTRAAAVVHDDVLATLTLAGSGLPIPRDRLAEQARRALRSVRELAAGTLTAPGTFADELAAAVTGRDPRARVVVAGEMPDGLPDDVHAALLGAALQAVDNSIRHAGPAASRTVAVAQRARGVVVTVTDDGVGFDPAAVPEDRLGVRVSIRGRVRDAGGEAEVVSRPGGGASVRLTWSAPTAEAIPDAADPRMLRVGVAVIAVVFTVTQLALAILAIPTARFWWVPLAVCLGLFTATEVLRRSPTAVPTRARLATVTALTLAVVVAGVALSPFTYAHLWFVTTAAFVFVAVAMRGCLRWATAGAVGLLAVVVAAGAWADAAPALVFMASVRAVAVVLIAVALTRVVARMQARTGRLHERAVRDEERAAWDAAAREELGGRAARAVSLAGPVLERIAAQEELPAEGRRTALAVEGRLRDELRAGRLATPAVVAAASRARERGVDVLLLDDAGDRDDLDLDAVGDWLAALLDTAAARAVGRLLPAGRGAAASATVDGGTTDFGG
ncbi:ATP-binding protein [Microbacterium sp. GXF7504]